MRLAARYFAPLFEWGNYNSGITGNEFSSFDRSLDGAKASWKSLTKRKDGQPFTGIPVANVIRSNYVDYEIDYAEGMILFRLSIIPTDQMTCGAQVKQTVEENVTVSQGRYQSGTGG